MTTTINASPTNGLVQTADGSGVLKVQSNGVTTNALAWVNFNGTGTVAIRSSYNVSSITDNGTGDYTINFTTAMTDANYAMVTASTQQDGDFLNFKSGVSPTTTAARIQCYSRADTYTAADGTQLSAAFFGN